MKHAVRTATLILGLFGTLAWAWQGHSWEAYEQLSTWRRPALDTPQAGKRQLVPLLTDPKDAKQPITTLTDWQSRRDQIERTVATLLGKPSGLSVPPVEVETIGQEVLPDHIRRHIRIRTEPDDWIPAYLLLPRNPGNRRRPTMVCLHQTVNFGKDEPCGIQGNPDFAFALELVRKGYVCIAPDVIGFGERIPAGRPPYHDNIRFFRKHPGWSCMGKMNWDVSRVIDYLETLPVVDPARIGCIGHSHGAYGSLFAAAFDPRIRLVIASCGFNTFRDDPEPHRWSHKTPLIPQLGYYLPKVEDIPFDFHEVLALIAPRPMFVWYATRDTIFPNTKPLDGMFKDVQSVYTLHGSTRELIWQPFEGPHAFPAEGRTRAYRWLDAHFQPKPAAPSKPASPSTKPAPMG